MTDSEREEIMKAATVEGSFLMYKDRPLVREGNTICYGNMSDAYYLQLVIMNTTEVNGHDVPDKIIIQIVNTDTKLSAGERIVKQDMKTGLAEAFELGVIWLERNLGE